jgi:hypothetical protein
MKRLANPLSHQSTVAKWLVISHQSTVAKSLVLAMTTFFGSGSSGLGRLEKLDVLSQARREQKIATTHIFDMSGVIFCEQHSIATKIGF